MQGKILHRKVGLRQALGQRGGYTRVLTHHDQMLEGDEGGDSLHVLWKEGAGNLPALLAGEVGVGAARALVNDSVLRFRPDLNQIQKLHISIFILLRKGLTYCSSSYACANPLYIFN